MTRFLVPFAEDKLFEAHPELRFDCGPKGGKERIWFTHLTKPFVTSSYMKPTFAAFQPTKV